MTLSPILILYTTDPVFIKEEERKTLFFLKKSIFLERSSLAGRYNDATVHSILSLLRYIIKKERKK